MADKQAENHAKQRICQQVGNVGVQRQCGERSPPLTVCHQSGLQATNRPPVPAKHPLCFQPGEHPDDQQIADNALHPGIDFRWRRRRRQLRHVLKLITFQMSKRLSCLRFRHQQAPVELVLVHLMLDVDRSEYQAGVEQ